MQIIRNGRCPRLVAEYDDPREWTAFLEESKALYPFLSNDRLLEWHLHEKYLTQACEDIRQADAAATRSRQEEEVQAAADAAVTAAAGAASPASTASARHASGSGSGATTQALQQQHPRPPRKSFPNWWG